MKNKLKLHQEETKWLGVNSTFFIVITPERWNCPTFQGVK